MASTKIRDIVVKVGEYTDRNTGTTKGRFENVGALMESDNNGEKSMFIMLKRTFNPAGVPGQDARESILLSCYVPQDQREQKGDNGGQSRGNDGHQHQGSTGGGSQGYGAGGGPNGRGDIDDQIPFNMEWRA